MLRPCLDCDTLVVNGPRRRCQSCEGRRERGRGSPTRRGYGVDHQRARRELAAQLPDICGYGCGAWLTPGGRWVAAHVVDGDPSSGWMAACPACNERAKHAAKVVLSW